MFFSTNHYPELDSLPKKEKSRVIQSAIRAEGKWVKRRFWGFLALLCFSAMLLSRQNLAIYFGTWDGVVVSLIVSSAFYFYLIWEINNGMYNALRKHLKVDREPGNEGN